MENKEGYDNFVSLPAGLSIEAIPKNKRPTEDDWKKLQGGKPEIFLINDKLCNVVHRYDNRKDPSGTGKVVPTSLAVVKNWERKTIDATVEGRQIEFPVAMVWKYHGKPCEGIGGTKYNTVQVVKKSDDSTASESLNQARK